MSTEQQPRVPAWKWILACAGLGIGVLGLLSSVSSLPDGAAFSSVVATSLAFAVPSAWWVYCTTTDERVARAVAERTGGTGTPPRVNRRWPAVVVVTLILLGLGVTFFTGSQVG